MHLVSQTRPWIAALIIGLLAVACGDRSSAGDDDMPPSDDVSLRVDRVRAAESIGVIEPTRDVFLIVDVTVSAADDVEGSAPVTPVQFSLVREDRSATVATSATALVARGCRGDAVLLAGGSTSCAVAFDVEASVRFQAVAFTSGFTGATTEAPTPVSTFPPTSAPALSCSPVRDPGRPSRGPRSGRTTTIGSSRAATRVLPTATGPRTS